MANLYSYQSANIRRTWVLFIVFFAVVLGVGYVFSRVYEDPSIVFFAGVFSIVYALISYFGSAGIALSLARAAPIEKKDKPGLYNLF